MAYVKAVIPATLGAVLAGTGTGVLDVISGALERLRPEDKAVVLAEAISGAMNNAAFFLLLFVPLATALVFAVQRWRRRGVTSAASP